MPLAPIVLFTYNRPWHTRQTVEALQKNELASESELFVYSDAPKNKQAAEAVAEVRNYIKEIRGFKNVTVIERDKNWGLANSIIDGVTTIVNRYGSIIVLEDDLVTSPYFLRFINEALDLYESEEKVVSIHGYIYPVQSKLPLTFFLRGADCWGWATWKRGWELFEKDARKLLNALEEKKLTKLFDFNGAYGYTRMLKDQIAGRNNSWAIRWHASAFLRERLTLYPGISLVRNVGLDGDGTHCGVSSVFDVTITKEPVMVKSIEIAENEEAKRVIENFLRSLRPSLAARALCLTRNYLKITKIKE